jgi:UDP-glucose 4-epimerase
LKKKVIVTGCAGFIGSNLVDLLLKKNFSVLGIDNLSTGHLRNLDDANKNKNFHFVKLDLLDIKKIKNLFKNIDMVFHLAANADVRYGIDNPKKDLEQNTIVTFNILESMRVNGVKKIIFSSTGSIYGETSIIPTPENVEFPIQTSFYGASKLACEGLIQAYCDHYNFKSWIFRFVSILGERYSHGHVYDFYKKLLKNNNSLSVLGNGKQKKSYLNIKDCLSAIMIAILKSPKKVNIYNLGTNQFSTVSNSVNQITKRLSLKPKINYKGGKRGWPGDVPTIYLNTRKIRKLGWKPKYTINESIIETLEFLIKNKWLLKKN